ncbi:thioredoxin family protein [Naasia lichenicola]|uniref:Thioredoxin family protein n=1 Tax=Naasia lichenicola TaxID=2565933 RepID=A0A4S4FIJ9_9MICO|nr:thioredoxin family protein [Naasia lichenicola]THG30160.1 thioredoxin family protein [Naasia lichenicola]
MTLNIGNRPPSFSLPAAGGGHALFEPGDGITVVVFTCNHCPYARAWHERIQKVAQDYTGRVTVLQINSNDSSRQPLDSFESMEAREAGGDFSSPYLRDEDQSVAKAWDAMVTPDVFIIDAEGELAYHGAPDGSYDDDSANAEWIRSALDDLIAGRRVAEPVTSPKGCGIKWKQASGLTIGSRP